MNTPIVDFVEEYLRQNPIRMHMPGHKGLGGSEYARDITEIPGADSLYEASGIIRESEQNASAIFGSHTFYSTEGSSHAIRAMLFLALTHGKSRKILAGRNAHKAFLSAAALLDLDVSWLYGDSYLTCSITADTLEAAIKAESPCAVYLTSPDYLGNTLDIAALSAVCKRYGVLLLVDNAHGAYLKFLTPSLHPMDLGADLCCDSAHKTLPVLTGGAYLHVRDEKIAETVKPALALFGSTSPSYLILQSLDRINPMLAQLSLTETEERIMRLKETLAEHGYVLVGNEPLKLTISTKSYGYTGAEFAEELSKRQIICEFFDPDFVVLMLSIATTDETFARLETVLCEIQKKPALHTSAPVFTRPKAVCSIREASFSRFETLPIADCCGRVLASASVACPPAVPIVMSGEEINQPAIDAFSYYGINECNVIKK
ncbi:MAG: aminotransferase class V-fold PLP-dependent enzyme [Oscillospiraceae bacterium]|nr:aminotransferase class V-fold PLP-dependent enzyme [Oscillospiraceae bacterium]